MPNVFDTIAAMPQFVQTDSPRTVFNVLSNYFLTERTAAPGLVLKSGNQVTALEGAALDKLVLAADMQATLLLQGQR